MITYASINTRLPKESFDYFVKLYNVKQLHINDVFSMCLFESDVEHLLKKKVDICNSFDHVISMFYNHYLNSLSIQDDDIVLYCRTDIVLNDENQIQNIIDSNILCNEVYIPYGSDYCGINDQLAIGRGSSMKQYLSVFTNIQAYCLDCNIKLHPESLLKHHLYTNGLIIKRFHLTYSLHRNRRKIDETVYLS
jgi:hypothetical protein